MKIAVTRLAGKEGSDAARCAKYGHVCYSVHPLVSEVKQGAVTAFAEAVERGDFDCLFFTSALPAKIIAPLLNRFPRVIAIGPQTAKELRSYEIECETLPSFYSRDFVPYLGAWIGGKHIGIPRADVPNPDLLGAIAAAGGIAHEFRCYSLEPTGQPLPLNGADAVLFTSAMSHAKAVWTPREGLLVMAIGEVTAAAMHMKGMVPAVVGDGSLEGTLEAFNSYLKKKEN
ncbi:MAG: uroporphyrinogen-III synthase [Methanoregula sp.]|nr:MAG: uroporphyrinogen-III synthase [Methanoregula sp.]